MLIVQKFGGTSVADLDCVRRVGERARKTFEVGNQVVVVLSAPAGETDQLIDLAKKIAPQPDPREYDQLLALGEQKSVALLGLYLKSVGVPCVSFTAAQIPIVTDNHHSQARILEIGVEKIQQALKEKKIVIITGFQGVTASGDVTTLGRGGSDTSAVALAAALRADQCEIYTDVDGVFSGDPRVVGQPKLLKKISYEEMIEMADSGAKVLHTRSAELAAQKNVPLTVRSSFNDGPGTEVVKEEGALEKVLVAGITLNTKEAKIGIRRVPGNHGAGNHGVMGKFFAPLARAGVNVDMIVENLGQDGTTDLAFTVPKENLRAALKSTEAVAKKLGAGTVEAAADIAKISLVGLGMRSHSGVAHKVFQILDDLNIHIQMVSTSEIKISLVVASADATQAVHALHDLCASNF